MGGADRASLTRMTLKVVENRKIPSVFICMQMRLLHKLTPDPGCQSSSWVDTGPPPGPLGHAAPPCTPLGSAVSFGFQRQSWEPKPRLVVLLCLFTDSPFGDEERLQSRFYSSSLSQRRQTVHPRGVCCCSSTFFSRQTSLSSLRDSH